MARSKKTVTFVKDYEKPYRRRYFNENSEYTYCHKYIKKGEYAVGLGYASTYFGISQATLKELKENGYITVL